ncbi:MAG TPA: class I SAM-dependent methyltransferase [Candidatus Paceibacterota bacterium]|nr:class I SAM-dependent methyltransferase [Candidatus Paceibacterota bacterium]
MDHKSSKTSWGKVADWYGEYLGNEDTYQAKVILPNLLRVLSLKPGEKVLDLACGQGFFAREFAKAGAQVVGADIAKELIAEAKKAGGPVEYYVAPASHLSFAKDAEFDAVVCVLALQNMEDINAVFKEVRRVLKPEGRFVIVLNHPAFRVLKRSAWGWDESASVQYRRIDGYLSAAKISVDMHPGAASSTKTISYHRSLQDFFKALRGASFAVTALEEWTSHKTSEKGPRQAGEDAARKEIPLFMLIEAQRYAQKSVK